MNENEDSRPLWHEVVLIVVPILVAEGFVLLREYIRQKKKERKRLERAATLEPGEPGEPEKSEPEE